MIHTRFALQRPVTTLMTFIAVALIGVISMTLLPLELFPDIRFPGIEVTIPYAGSTPEEVEQLITRPADQDKHDHPRWLALLRSLFCGLYTVDNMDFVLRDAFMSGYSTRAYDLDRLLQLHDRGGSGRAG